MDGVVVGFLSIIVFVIITVRDVNDYVFIFFISFLRLRLFRLGFSFSIFILFLVIFRVEDRDVGVNVFILYRLVGILFFGIIVDFYTGEIRVVRFFVVLGFRDRVFFIVAIDFGRLVRFVIGVVIVGL